MPEKITINYPGVPITLNQILKMGGVWTRIRQKKVWQNMLNLFTPAQKKALRQLAAAKRKMRIDVTVHCVRERDQDGLYGSCKHIFDILVDAEMLHDDSPKYLEMNVGQAHCKYAEQRTEISISPA